MRVCVYLCMYVRAYLAIPCVSANDNVKHIKYNDDDDYDDDCLYYYKKLFSTLD